MVLPHRLCTAEKHLNQTQHTSEEAWINVQIHMYTVNHPKKKCLYPILVSCYVSLVTSETGPVVRGSPPGVSCPVGL